MTFAKGNTYRQIASIIPDRSIDNNAKYVCIMSLHNSMNGRRALCQAAELYFKNENKKIRVIFSQLLQLSKAIILC